MLYTAKDQPLELSIKTCKTDAVEAAVTQYKDSVELVINDSNDTNSTHKSNMNKHCLWRSIFMLFIICCVDMIIFYYMSNIYYQARIGLNTTVSIGCTYELEFLSNPLYVIIPSFCLIATLFLVISAKRLYVYSTGTKARPIIIYLIAVIVHTILFWYENTLISNIKSHISDITQGTSCVDVSQNITIITHALMIKAMLFNAAFIISFMYYICFCGSRRKCVIISVVISLIIFISMFLWIDTTYIHGVSALFALLHIKCHLCSAAHAGASTKTNTHHLTTTYVENYQSEWEKEGWPCCPGGCCCEHGCKGCCEWKFKGGFCVVCYGGCGDYPKSLCFSCCGMCSCFCCDAGGCYGACCCSYDFFTWCGCGCC